MQNAVTGNDTESDWFLDPEAAFVMEAKNESISDSQHRLNSPPLFSGHVSDIAVFQPQDCDTRTDTTLLCPFFARMQPLLERITNLICLQSIVHFQAAPKKMSSFKILRLIYETASKNQFS
jgi:hypothetical protein